MPIFDKEAKHYDNFFTTPLGKYIDEVESEALFRLLEVKKGQKVLDYGAGSGNLTQKLKWKGAQVIGIDISSEMQKLAIQKELDVRLYDGKTIPFPDESFEVVTSLAVFEFLEDVKEAMEEIMRVLKPGGRLYVGTICKKGPYATLYKSQAFQDSVFRHATFLDEESFLQLGYQPIAKETCLYLPPNEEMNWESEEKRQGEGGFLWVVFQK